MRTQGKNSLWRTFTECHNIIVYLIQCSHGTTISMEG